MEYFKQNYNAKVCAEFQCQNVHLKNPQGKLKILTTYTGKLEILRTEELSV